jgi:HEPN domain-containing protein
MTNHSMTRNYLRQAATRLRGLVLYLQLEDWPTVVREAQEAVELCLKAALRFAAVEPARTHDVAEVLRRNASRFPDWFSSEVPSLATISTVLAGQRGPAFYGDERLHLPPDALFDQGDAERAKEQAEYVHGLCSRLLAEESVCDDTQGGSGADTDPAAAAGPAETDGSEHSELAE